MSEMRGGPPHRDHAGVDRGPPRAITREAPRNPAVVAVPTPNAWVFRSKRMRKHSTVGALSSGYRKGIRALVQQQTELPSEMWTFSFEVAALAAQFPRVISSIFDEIDGSSVHAAMARAVAA